MIQCDGNVRLSLTNGETLLTVLLWNHYFIEPDITFDGFYCLFVAWYYFVRITTYHRKIIHIKLLKMHSVLHFYCISHCVNIDTIISIKTNRYSVQHIKFNNIICAAATFHWRIFFDCHSYSFNVLKIYNGSITSLVVFTLFHFWNVIGGIHTSAYVFQSSYPLLYLLKGRKTCRIFKTFMKMIIGLDLMKYDRWVGWSKSAHRWSALTREW